MLMLAAIVSASIGQPLSDDLYMYTCAHLHLSLSHRTADGRGKQVLKGYCDSLKLMSTRG